jgi:hypothetical protein
MTVAVAVAAEATTETTEQEDDEEDDEYESDRHDLSPIAAPDRTLSPFALQGEAFIGAFHYSFSSEIKLLPALTSAVPSEPSVRPSKLEDRWLFGRLPVEVLFVRLCVCLGGMHYAVAMVRRSIERVELHWA